MHRKRVMERKRENLGLTSVDFSSVNITHRGFYLVSFERPNTSLKCNRAGFCKKKIAFYIFNIENYI